MWQNVVPCSKPSIRSDVEGTYYISASLRAGLGCSRFAQKRHLSKKPERFFS